MFQRVGAAAYRPDLGNINALCAILGMPQNDFRSVHIAGTNGKGSVAHMLAAILQTAGYKTGLSTSPHLVDFRERIRVNGEMIPEEQVSYFVSENREHIDRLTPSFFEVSTAMAFWYFNHQKVDIAIIETGMGGRLDSTNIITPLLSVITNIGLDHTQVLGDSLPAIAAEKAGIIKKGVPVVIGEYHPATAPVFVDKAGAMGSAISFASKDWRLDQSRVSTAAAMPAGKTVNAPLEITARSTVYGKQLQLRCELNAVYQEMNIKTVLSAVEEMKRSGLKIGDEHIKEALMRVKALTGLAGRWQVLDTAPLTICDTGHNKDGIRQVLCQIKATPHRELHFVFGLTQDKEVEGILKMLPQDARYYFCKAQVARGLDEQVLCKKAKSVGLRGGRFSSVRAAIDAARKEAAPEDLVFIGGSTFVVAEATVPGLFQERIKTKNPGRVT